MVNDLLELNERDMRHAHYLKERLDGAQNFESVRSYLIDDTLTNAELAFATQVATICDRTYFLGYLTVGIVIVLDQLSQMVLIKLQFLIDFVEKSCLILRPIILKLHGLFLIDNDKLIVVLAIF